MLMQKFCHQPTGWQKLAAFRRGQKKTAKIFVRPVFAIFVTTAKFLRVTANSQIKFSIMCDIYHEMMHFLTMKHYCCSKNTFLPQIFQKIHKLRQILISQQSSVCQCLQFSTSKHFGEGPSCLRTTSATLPTKYFSPFSSPLLLLKRRQNLNSGTRMMLTCGKDKKTM